MTFAEKTSILRNICGMTVDDLSDDTLVAYLNIAEGIILRKCYPTLPDTGTLTMPKKYGYLQVEIANELIQKRGAEGETSHTENSVARYYESAGVSSSLLNQIVPCARVVAVTGEKTS